MRQNQLARLQQTRRQMSVNGTAQPPSAREQCHTTRRSTHASGGDGRASTNENGTESHTNQYEGVAYNHQYRQGRRGGVMLVIASANRRTTGPVRAVGRARGAGFARARYENGIAGDAWRNKQAMRVGIRYMVRGRRAAYNARLRARHYG